MHKEVTGKSRSTAKSTKKSGGSDWSRRYGERHRQVRITEFPPGIASPDPVRLYLRRDHYVLQWWDPAAKRTLSDRVNGDLVEAISRARKIAERLTHLHGSGQGPRRIGHEELVTAFLRDMDCRANANQVSPRTAERYRTILQRHYLPFTQLREVEREFRYVASVNRDFHLRLGAYLQTSQVCPNGRRSGHPRPMRSPAYVIDVARAMYAWAADPNRGGLMPDGFRSPFVRGGRQARAGDLFGDPDMSVAEACRFFEACDAFQLRLFAPMALYGLRAAEPCYLFFEDLDKQWLHVNCLPELGYSTKGRRDKRLPLLPCLDEILRSGAAKNACGLLYLSRRALPLALAALATRSGQAKTRPRDYPLLDHSRAALAAEYQRRCRTVTAAAQRQKIRDAVLAEAGGLNYQHAVAEFRKLHQQIGLRPEATLKDFRHLASTLMENAGVPEHYRKYVLGQSPGTAPITRYTHLNELPQRYAEAVQRSFRPLVLAIAQRGHQLGLCGAIALPD